mmetsp:Transcript_52913/g.103478  ORF Transcript_52913/g.103478 Transcript_52913/m.103478 type:complete len:285 (+) Transcript_52913:170-1024(+)
MQDSPFYVPLSRPLCMSSSASLFLPILPLVHCTRGALLGLDWLRIARRGWLVRRGTMGLGLFSFPPLSLPIHRLRLLLARCPRFSTCLRLGGRAHRICLRGSSRSRSRIRRCGIDRPGGGGGGFFPCGFYPFLRGLSVPWGDLEAQILHQKLHHIVTTTKEAERTEGIELCLLQVDNHKITRFGFLFIRFKRIFWELIRWLHSQTAAQNNQQICFLVFVFCAVFVFLGQIAVPVRDFVPQPPPTPRTRTPSPRWLVAHPVDLGPRRVLCVAPVTMFSKHCAMHF